MYKPTHQSERIRRASLVALALGTSVIFVWMIWDFLMALFLSAILSGIFHPLYRRLNRRFYLRPRYLWRRLCDARSVGELTRQAREGWALLRRNSG